MIFADRAEIVHLAQPFCDEAMEGNHFAGRDHSGWTRGIKVLEQHSLVERVTHRGFNRAVGRWTSQRDQIVLTQQGRHFVELLLGRLPEPAPPGDWPPGWPLAPGGPTCGRTPGQGGIVPNSASYGGVRALHPPRNTQEADDEARLRAFVASNEAGPLEMRLIRKDRRIRLHVVCEHLDAVRALSIPARR
eukprot:1188758-Prorocentrum_minimum.AAC.1